MKKLTVALMLALSCALLSGVQAQKNAPTKMGGTKTPPQPGSNECGQESHRPGKLSYGFIAR